MSVNRDTKGQEFKQETNENMDINQLSSKNNNNGNAIYQMMKVFRSINDSHLSLPRATYFPTDREQREKL